MRYLYGLTVVLLACLVGCKPKEQTPETPEKPPPLSAAKIHGDYKAALKPLFNAAGPNGNLGYGDKNAIISEFKTVRNGMLQKQEENEPEAKTKIEKDVSNSLKTAKKAEQWFAVDALLDVHAYLRPESQSHTSLRRRSDLMMARPWVKCTGFVQIGDEDLQVMLEIMDPKTKAIESVVVREGEEFYPNAEGESILRLVRVVGAQSAVEMEYLPLPGETWEELGPKNR